MNSKFQKAFFYRHIAIVGVLCFFIGSMQAQLRPKQLRNEILQSQNPTPKNTGNKNTNKKVRQQGRPVNPMTPLAPIVNPLSTPNATIIYMDNANVVVADVASLLSGVNLSESAPEPPGCMSGPDDPDCLTLLPAFGLDVATGRCSEVGCATQTFFRVK